MTRVAGRFRSVKLRITLGSIAALALGIGFITALVVGRAEQDMLHDQRQRELGESVRTADILSRRVVHLQRSLQAAARQMEAMEVDDDMEFVRFLESKQVLRSIFNGLFIIAPTGQMRYLVDEQGVRTFHLDLSRRPYVMQTVSERRPVISPPVRSKVSGEWIVIFTMPVRGRNGEVQSVLAGSLRLASRDLLDDLTEKIESDANALMLVADSTGRVLAPARQVDAMKEIADEPRLGTAFKEWVARGSSAEPSGLHLNQPGELVTVAGVAGTDWVVWRARPEADLLQPLRDAKEYSFFWACVLVACLSLLLLSLLWWLLMPLSELRRRAAHAVDKDMAPDEGWPDCGGELGELAEVLKEGAIERQRLEAEKQHLLQMLSSALDSAPIGIAFVREDKFELVSTGFCGLFGWDKFSMVGRPIGIIFLDGPPPKRQKLESGFTGGRTGEWQMERSDGSCFWGQLKCNPLDPSDPSVGSIWTLSDVTSQRDAHQQLEWAATHDSLTRLANRKLFERRAGRLIDALPQSAPAAIVYLDLDRFKPINDTEGHAAGDAVLVEIANVLCSSIRPGDLAARIGGDEFALLLERCEPEVALKVANKVCERIAALEVAWEAKLLRVGASAGVAELSMDATDVAGWLDAADQACYAAKAAGRGTVRTLVAG